MTIKAIQTEYKGYRFRSRLEARWAVFFDALGLDWTYEVEGYDLDGVWYLPDFFVRGKGKEMFIEIKPLDDSALGFTTIYLAGKIGGDNWRGPLVDILNQKCERFATLGDVYISHDQNNEYIVDECLSSIDEASVVYANITTDDTPGTLIELGYAKAKGKKIIIRFENSDLQERLWFACSFADTVIVGGDIADPIIEILPPLRQTFDKCRRLSRNGKPIILMQGDPAEAIATVFMQGYEHDWGNHIDMICRVYLTGKSTGVPEAAKKARSARFEHGEKG